MRVPAKPFLLLGMLVACLALATGQNAQQAHSWNAKWIASPDLPGKVPAVVHFRKVLNLSGVPSHFIVHVSADNAFLLHVNQQRVGNGPSKGDLAHWRYETYDLAPFLHAGPNVIAATVWNFAEHAAAAQISDRLGFMLQGGDGADTKVSTDENWEVESEPGMAVIPTPFNVLPNSYYAAEPRERIDGSVLDWAWDAPERGLRSHWTKASTVGDATLHGSELVLNNWQLVPDPLPGMERKLLPPGKIVRSHNVAHAERFPGTALAIPANVHASVLIDNGELTTAYPELIVSGGKEAAVRTTYAEALKDKKGEKGNRNEIEGKEISGVYDEFLPDGAEERTLSPLVWRTWRYLQIDITTRDQPMEIKNFRSWFTAFPFVERAKFSSDDPELSTIWSIGWRTARLDAHDTYMDTPYWEQLQYIGDTRIQALISYAVAGDNRLARQ